MTLIEVIYVSTATDKLFAWELRRILESSVRNNEDEHLTGMLLYSRNSFMQVLEGDKETVDNALARIAQDPRHCNIKILARSEISHREFDRWSMGFHGINAADATTWPGFAPYFQNGFDADALATKPGLALGILKAFAKGEIDV